MSKATIASLQVIWQQGTKMAKEHAIKAAQVELLDLGVRGVVIDVKREGREALICLTDGRTLALDGWAAIKLLKMLRTSYLRVLSEQAKNRLKHTT